jgi:hypothetical protein
MVLFDEMVSGIEANLEELKKLGGQFLHDYVMLAFRFAVQSTKHPSFAEEREWRVLYTPTILSRRGDLTEEQARRIPTQIACIKGVPQRIYEVPFVNYPDEGFAGATPPELLDRVLVGPSVDAYAIAQAFLSELIRLQVPDADQKVTITGIPLRT